MVFSFFRSGDRALDHVDQEVATMLGECRHSLDLALGSLSAGGDVAALGEEIRATDRRINASEEAVRRDLIVHTTVQGGSDVGAVLASILVVKKLERVGDQAKNIFDLAAEGVRFTEAADAAELRGIGVEVSSRIAEAAAILGEPDDERAQAFIEVCEARMRDLDGRVNELMHSDEPADHAVPRAMYFRYLKRIVANVVGAVETLTRPLDRRDDLDE
jgi:phosphate uptake regulator